MCLGRNMVAFLSLPLVYRLFPKIQREPVEIQNEGRSARQRWTIRDKSAHGPETFEDYRKRKETEEDARQPRQGDQVDFSNLRATDFLSNKVLHMPGPASHKEELKIKVSRLSY